MAMSTMGEAMKESLAKARGDVIEVLASEFSAKLVMDVFHRWGYLVATERLRKKSANEKEIAAEVERASKEAAEREELERQQAQQTIAQLQRRLTEAEAEAAEAAERAAALVERFDIEPFPDFSAK